MDGVVNLLNHLLNALGGFELGAVVQIDEWQPDGSASVKYRGAQWNAVLRPGQAAIAGLYRIAEMEGSSLVVEPSEPQADATSEV